MSVAFDTLKAARRLRDAGLPEAQAEALADLLRESRDTVDLSDLATKADLDALRLATKADLDALRIATKADLDALRLATKADLDAPRIAAKADLDALRIAAKADIAEAKADLMKWMFGAIGLQAVVIVGAVVTLVRVIGPAN